MILAVSVEARKGYHIWVKFSDGVEGEVDLSSLRSRGGFFENWDDRQVFEDARIDESGDFIWVGEVDLCPEPFYFELTGVPIEEAEKGLHHQVAHA